MKDLVVIILSELSRYLESLVGLLSGPKSFVRRRGGDREKSLVQSFTFLGVSFGLYSLLLSSLRSPKDFLQQTAPDAIGILVASLLYVGVLRISWRMVGGKASFDKHLIIFLYYSGVGLLIAGACLLLTLGMVRSLYPKLFEALKIYILVGGSQGDALLKQQIDAMVEAGNVAGLLLSALIVGGLPPAAVWIWTYIGWGAYRELNRASKRASAMAFIVNFFSPLPSSCPYSCSLPAL